MRKQVLTFALSAIFGVGAAIAAPIAQDQSTAPQSQEQGQGRHRGMDPNKQVQFLTKKLNLSSDQQSQILTILTNQQQQMQALHNDSSVSREDRMAKMRSIREDSRTKIEGVLNADQKQTYDQMRQQNRARHEEQNSGAQPQ